jgi:hypothetical protein
MMQKCRFFAVCLLVAVTAVATMPSAWSFERSAVQPVVKFKAVADDACRPLLINVSTQSTVQKARLNSDDNARKAALIMMLGVRSAVGPKEGTAAFKSSKTAGVDNDRALAIARYRHCRNQQVLESLASN